MFYYDKYSLKTRLKFVKAALKQRCKHHENYCLNRLERWFYTLKTCVCLILHREKSLYSVDCIDAVAVIDLRPSIAEYSGYDWIELSVGYGILKNWHFDIYSNGSY
jgi:hypothetical protein